MKKSNTIYARDVSPSNLIAFITESLENDCSHVLIKDLGLPIQHEVAAAQSFAQLCEQIGECQPHDNREIVWHIRPNAEKVSKVKTYSEHNDEAPFHTDAQYRAKPENYFGLLTLRKADCGGGLSGLITHSTVMKMVKSHPLGKEMEKLFREKELPFAVPSIFSLTKKQQLNEAVFAPILYDENKIRYRFDTLMKGLEYYPHLVTPVELELIRQFDEMINASMDKIEFMLEDGDVLFVNNERSLHRRSSFSDLNRHLLRVRFNRRNK